MNAICLDESPHPVEVVLKAFLIRERRRQAQVFIQKIPAKLRDLAGLNWLIEKADSLVQGSNCGRPLTA